MCPPRILEFDVRTRQVLRVITIPPELIHNSEDSNKGRLEIGAVEFKRYDVWVSPLWIIIDIFFDSRLLEQSLIN